MGAESPSPFDRMRNPEHTGVNRCVPCTVVNVILAAGVSVTVGIVSIRLGLLVGLVALGTIWLRGYLVPGTPQLTARYLPDRVRSWFGKTERDSALPDDDFTSEAIERLERERENRVDAAAFLADAGIVEGGGADRETDGGDRQLTDWFRTRVADRLDDGAAGDRRDALAELFDASPSGISFPDRDYPAVKVGHRIRRWPSEAALRADLASHAVLADTTDGWERVPVDQRVELLESIRSLFETCPDCGGPVTFDETTVESCCFASSVVTHRCGACAARLVEFDPEAAESGTGYRGAIS